MHIFVWEGPMSDGNHRDPRQAGKKPPFDDPEQAATGSTKEMRNKPDHGEANYRGHARLQDRAALITGADSGIGRAVALAFAREGADVAISYLQHHEDAQETLRLVESAGQRGLTLGGDVAEDAHAGRLVQATVERFGRLDVLVNNAAFRGKAVERFEDLTPDRVLHTFRVNIVAMFNLVRHALPHLRPGAAIINVASHRAAVVRRAEDPGTRQELAHRATGPAGRGRAGVRLPRLRREPIREWRDPGRHGGPDPRLRPTTAALERWAAASACATASACRGVWSI
jgi:NAD(P)-dependent dehydrogenase (short-subunit alcohol dehydrogenase family)